LLGLAEITLCHYKNYKDALVAYTNLMENNPSGAAYINYILGRAKCLKALGKDFAAWRFYRQALKMVKKFLKEDPKDAVMIAALGETYHGLKKYDKAKECVDSARQNVDPGRITLFMPLSFSLFHGSLL